MKPSLSAPHLHSYPQPRKQAGQRAEATAAAWKPVPSHPPEAAHRAVFRRGCTVRTQARRSTLIAGRRSILSGDPHVKQAKQTEEGRSRAHCLNNEGSLARETLLVTKEARLREGNALAGGPWMLTFSSVVYQRALPRQAWFEVLRSSAHTRRAALAGRYGAAGVARQTNTIQLWLAGGEQAPRNCTTEAGRESLPRRLGGCQREGRGRRRARHLPP